MHVNTTITLENGAGQEGAELPSDPGVLDVKSAEPPATSLASALPPEDREDRLVSSVSIPMLRCRDKRPWRKWTVMLVDDDPTDSRLIVKILNEIGIAKVLWIKTRGGMNFQLSVDDELVPDVVVLEPLIASARPLQMLRDIRRHPNPRVQKIPIVVITSNRDARKFEKACLFGVSGYLNKPIGIDSLRSALVCAKRNQIIERPWSRQWRSRISEASRKITFFSTCLDIFRECFARPAATSTAKKQHHDIDLLA